MVYLFKLWKGFGAAKGTREIFCLYVVLYAIYMGLRLKEVKVSSRRCDQTREK